MYANTIVTIAKHNSVDTLEVVENLAQRLKTARQFRAWTQSQLAVAAGVSTSTVGNIESGIRKAPGSLPALAEALRISYTWLSHGKGEMLAVALTEGASPFSPEATALAKLFDLIPLADTLKRGKAQAICGQAIIDLLQETSLTPVRTAPDNKTPSK